MIILISFSFILTAEDCDKEVSNKDLNFRDVKITYTGCVDRFGNPSGEGVMYIQKKKKKEKYQEGYFKNGKLNGFGRKYSGKIYIEGNFTNGDKVNGIFLQASIDGVILYQEYKEGEIIKQWTNTDSKYSKDDIIKTSEDLEIELIKHPNYRNAYFIEVKVGLEDELFLFDTGAFGNFLTKKMLKELRKTTNVELIPVKNQTVTLGGGEKVPMKYYLVENLKFEKFELKNVVFCVLNKETDNAECILGMDIFENKFSEFNPDFINKKIYLKE